MPDIATPLFSFDEAEETTVLASELERAVQEHFGISGFRSGQQQVIQRVMQGRSTLALMPTGAGKSLCYQLPALLLPQATIVISPLIALMKDQLDGLPPAVREKATIINSQISFDEVRQRLRAIAKGTYKLVYVAPERLRQRQFLHALQQVGISLFVVDEAHCVSLWGFSFRPDYLFIRQAIQTLNNPPVLALTATATQRTEQEIIAQLGKLEIVRTNVFRPNLQLEVIKASNLSEKEAVVVELCQKIEGNIIVYVRSRLGCEKMAEQLQQAGIQAEAYHANCPDRNAIQDRFMRGETRVIAATIAFGMGVDKRDVRAVIHLTLPKSLEDYAQEAGRAGRDGKKSRCILLYTPSDKRQLSDFMQQGELRIEQLRDIYKHVVRLMSGYHQHVITSQELIEATNAEETTVRVALGILEHVGLVRRHYDLPRVSKVRVLDADYADPQFKQFCRLFQLDGYPLDCDTLAIADALDCEPAVIEQHLLTWHEAGALQYEGFNRDMLIELLPAAKDTRERMAQVLREWRIAQEKRLDDLTDYVKSKHCRHRVMAAHFGQRLQPCGDGCDICRANAPRWSAPPPILQHQSAPLRVQPTWGSEPMSDHQRIIIETVQQNPNAFSSRDLAHILAGSRGYGSHAMFGMLASRSFDSIRAEIDVLVDAGKLAYRGATLIAVEKQRQATDTPEMTILRSLTRLRFGLGRSGLAKLLKGASDANTQSPDWGALRDQKLETIEQLIEAMVTNGVLQRQTSGKFPLIMLSDVGKAVLSGHAPMPSMTVTTRKTQSIAVQPDQRLLDRLKTWRADEATRQNVPRFMILADSVLFDLAAHQPTALAELRTIKGMGERKIMQYGEAILAIMLERDD